MAANNIASWDGSGWSPLGSGTNYSVADLTVHDNNLVVAGWFMVAGSKVSPYLARWTKHDNCCAGRVGDANGLGDYPTRSRSAMS